MSDIKHQGDKISADEDLTLTLENTIVLKWLELIHPGLPQLVKQKYGAELRHQTLASIKPEISQALSSLLDELQTAEETRAMQTKIQTSRFSRPNTSRQFPRKSCALCKAAKRQGYDTHWLQNCQYLPEGDKHFFAKALLLEDFEEENDPLEEEEADEPSALLDKQYTVRRVNVVQSPYLDVHYREHAIRLTIDCGATTNMVRASVASLLRLPTKPASQGAQQADGVTPLVVIGETMIHISCGQETFKLCALVLKNLDVEITSWHALHARK